MVGNEAVNKNGVYLPAGSEMLEERGGKQPPQGGLHGKQSPRSQGQSDMSRLRLQVDL